MFKLFVFFFTAFFINQLWADDCLICKNIPRVFIDEPDYTTQVIQSSKNMDLWHGNVIATLVDKYDIITDVKSVNNGYCVSLKTVNSVFGYNNFLVNINIQHTPNTCAYNVILEHENKHINTYLSVINDFKKELQDSIFNASDSIMPIFIKTKSDVDLAVNKMNQELQSHPELVLIKQKIRAAQEIRNKKIDQMETGEDLFKCFE